MLSPLTRIQEGLVGPPSSIFTSQSSAAKSANEHEAACFVRTMRLLEPSDHVSVHTSTVLSEFIWHKTFEPVPSGPPVIPIPLDKIENEPLGESELLLLSVPEPVNVPSVATVSVPISHQGALGPVTKLLKSHVPARSAIVAPLVAKADTGSRQITQMKMNSPYSDFNRLILHIPLLPGDKNLNNDFVQRNIPSAPLCTASLKLYKTYCGLREYIAYFGTVQTLKRYVFFRYHMVFQNANGILKWIKWVINIPHTLPKTFISLIIQNI
jgi:hypothetical protein